MTGRKYLIIIFFCMSCVVSGMSQSPPWSGIIDPSRAVNWTGAGASIPTRSTICATPALNSGSGAASANTKAIQSAIAGCPANQVVSLPAGTWYIAGITFGGVSNVTLRGAGPDQTFLMLTGYADCWGWKAGICIPNSDMNWIGGPANQAKWTAGYAQGATQITLASAGNIHSGSTVLILDQNDDASDPGTTFVCVNAGTCSTEGEGGNARSGRDQQQYVQVTGCSPACPNNGSTVVTISPGLYMPNWSAAKSPGAWWASTQATGNGIESLSIDASSAGTSTQEGNVMFFNASGNWMSNVRSINAARSHVVFYLANHDTVRDSYFFGTQSSAAMSYGVEGYGSGQNLVENNICHHVAGCLMPNGSASGTVVAYNYSVDSYYTPSKGWLDPGAFDHGSTDYVLYEGNESNGLIFDAIHASANFHTAFRNYLTGWSPGMNGDTIPLNIFTYHRYMNVVGNVLGSSNQHSHYQVTPASATDSGNANVSNVSIFALGWATTQGQGCNGCAPGGVSLNNDTFTPASAMRWGNYDVVTAGARWCGNSSDPGWSTTCGGVSEVPSGLSAFGNAVPGSTTLPQSFYLSAQPAFWSMAGSLVSPPWPAVGPDVTGGNVPNVGGFANHIPAARCFAAQTSIDSNYSSGNTATITAISESGRTIKLTFNSTPGNFQWSSQVVNISGSSVADYNTNWQIGGWTGSTVTLDDPNSSGFGACNGSCGTATVNPVFLYNANSCYYGGGQPLAPQNLKATVH
jgi:hypothetical protein